jgi:hypothetical protein
VLSVLKLHFESMDDSPTRESTSPAESERPLIRPILAFGLPSAGFFLNYSRAFDDMSLLLTCPDLHEQHLLVSMCSLRFSKRSGRVAFWRCPVS